MESDKRSRGVSILAIIVATTSFLATILFFLGFLLDPEAVNLPCLAFSLLLVSLAFSGGVQLTIFLTARGIRETMASTDSTIDKRNPMSIVALAVVVFTVMCPVAIPDNGYAGIVRLAATHFSALVGNIALASFALSPRWRKGLDMAAACALISGGLAASVGFMVMCLGGR